MYLILEHRRLHDIQGAQRNYLAYSVIRAYIASSVMWMPSAGTPDSFWHWGSKYRRAMATFSSAMYPEIRITCTDRPTV